MWVAGAARDCRGLRRAHALRTGTGRRTSIDVLTDTLKHTLGGSLTDTLKHTLTVTVSRIVQTGSAPKEVRSNRDRLLMDKAVEGRMDARIGILNGGKFYAFANGYHTEPVMGALEEVETALGLRPVAANLGKTRGAYKLFNVVLRFKHPAWDEVNGLEYRNVSARSKSEANKIARDRAYDDGHTVGRRAWFTATEA